MKTVRKSLEFNIVPVDDGFAYDVRLLEEDATAEEYILLLDAFLDEKVAPCLGCDLCCSQRIPLTLPDIYTYAGFDRENIADFIKEKTEIRRSGRVLDISLGRRADGSCIFLDRENHRCLDHPHRSLVCHSYICLPQTERARNLREELINRGEDALASYLLRSGLADNGGHDGDYPLDACWEGHNFSSVLLREVLSPSVFEALK